MALLIRSSVWSVVCSFFSIKFIYNIWFIYRTIVSWAKSSEVKANDSLDIVSQGFIILGNML